MFSFLIEINMILTDYHSKYFAYELTKHCASDSMDRFAVAVAGAQVDLNPHQVDAALFAFKSPFSKGALLADDWNDCSIGTRGSSRSTLAYQIILESTT
ncbi:MAG: hypothetical protein H7829_07470 [Magnetococcus sp. THC-1_WYH]